ncbi:MAG: GNAT family N-acetyltransferase [SAR202 cluster bacterium]|nr:GNAT family N-acetyltransferase [SAR202 cluster bacterium]MQG54281.1 GNAT family N-acetyltransferase [SAR202 cluster bacterium]|tara:strand:- start:5537 stop:6025 length:489 start_codon:yes stop_codon:yes gene_type:complete
MANKIRIEPAKPGDAPLVLQFIKGLADYEKLTDEMVATEDNIHESLFGADANAEAYLAYHEDEAVGCAIFCQHYSTYSGRSSLYLEDIFVLPEWRSYGIGRKLMAYGAGLAQSRGYPRMEWSVLDWNEPAIGFYEKLGAERLEGWYIYRLSEDALKRLGPDS